MPSHVLAFAFLSFILIIIPGPNVLFVVSRSLTLGHAAGVGSAVGGQIGVYMQVAAVAFGIGAVAYLEAEGGRDCRAATARGPRGGQGDS